MMENTKRVKAKELIATWQADPAFQEAYAELDETFALKRLFIEARKRANLSQAEVAEHMATSQSSITRLERGDSNPSLDTLRRYAKATGHKLEISFNPL